MSAELDFSFPNTFKQFAAEIYWSCSYNNCGITGSTWKILHYRKIIGISQAEYALAKCQCLVDNEVLS